MLAGMTINGYGSDDNLRQPTPGNQNYAAPGDDDRVLLRPTVSPLQNGHDTIQGFDTGANDDVLNFSPWGSPGSPLVGMGTGWRSVRSGITALRCSTSATVATERRIALYDAGAHQPVNDTAAEIAALFGGREAVLDVANGDGVLLTGARCASTVYIWSISDAGGTGAARGRVADRHDVVDASRRLHRELLAWTTSTCKGCRRASGLRWSRRRPPGWPASRRGPPSTAPEPRRKTKPTPRFGGALFLVDTSDGNDTNRRPAVRHRKA